MVTKAVFPVTGLGLSGRGNFREPNIVGLVYLLVITRTSFLVGLLYLVVQGFVHLFLSKSSERPETSLLFRITVEISEISVGEIRRTSTTSFTFGLRRPMAFSTSKTTWSGMLAATFYHFD